MKLVLNSTFTLFAVVYSGLALPNGTEGDTVLIDGVERTPAAVVEHPYEAPMKVFLSEEEDEKIKRNKDNLSRQGFIEKLDQPPRAEYVKARMAERRELAKLKGSSELLESMGFTEMNSVNFGSLPFSVTLLDERYIKSGSENYLLLGGHKLKQLYTKTEFGNLIIDEMPNSTAVLPSANIEINGDPATFTHVKHKGDKWASVVYVASSGKLFVIESDTKLTGKKKALFIDMVSDLVVRSN